MAWVPTKTSHHVTYDASNNETSNSRANEDSMQDVTWDASQDVSWDARNDVSWRTKNLNLAILTVFSVSSVTWTFDIFGNFKMNVRAFQYFYKGIKPIIEALRDYLIMNERDCLGNKQDSFPTIVFMYVWLWKIAWQGYQRIWHA